MTEIWIVIKGRQQYSFLTPNSLLTFPSRYKTIYTMKASLGYIFVTLAVFANTAFCWNFTTSSCNVDQEKQCREFLDGTTTFSTCSYGDCSCNPTTNIERKMSQCSNASQDGIRICELHMDGQDFLGAACATYS